MIFGGRGADLPRQDPQDEKARAPGPAERNRERRNRQRAVFGGRFASSTNNAVEAVGFCYVRIMTIEIAGPAQKVPGRSVLARWIIAAVVLIIFLWLSRVAAEVLVDWLWFSSVGYLQVFWTSFAAEAAVVGGVFTATTAVLWVNGWLARRLARRS